MEQHYKEGIIEENTKNTKYKPIVSTTYNEMEERSNTKIQGETAEMLAISYNETNTSHFQQLKKDSADVESTFSALIEDSPIDFQDLHDFPLSEELRLAMTNMEGIDAVDVLVGDVLHSNSTCNTNQEFVPNSTVDALVGDVLYADSTCDTNQEMNEQFMSSSVNDGDGAKCVNPLCSETNIVSDLQEKDRLKKDNHNIVERRRRYNINDRIKELGSLLPTSIPQSMKLNKGSILRASVEYVKELKKDKEKLTRCEAKQKVMETKYQKLLIRKFQVELKMKLHGFTEELDCIHGTKNKKPRKRFEEVDEIVESLIKQSLRLKSKTIWCATNSPFKRQAKPKLYCNNRNTKNPKADLEKFITKKLYKETLSDYQSNFIKDKSNQNRHILSSEQGNADNTNDLVLPQNAGNVSATSMMEAGSLPLIPSSYELSIKQSNILLDLLGRQKIGIVQHEPSRFSTSRHHLSRNGKATCTSPIKGSTSMLETLLKKSEKTPSVANSIEMSTGETN
ncbi:uncharacterized protein LOC133171592 [Saccostrea echinata]|uniref:uncharacterized protein LOC133171592 n=1 Tax=Saccostrea echinata TaxID=191078 RepID=UPI002A839FF4|nr:uncharacterized protein LOC133171592 [Saccostrea echinata]